MNDSIRLNGGECSPSRPRAANLNTRKIAATQSGHANLAAAAGKLTLSEMRRSTASSHYCKLTLSKLENYVFYTWQLSLPKLVAWWAGGSPSPAANSCYFPNWKTDISENLALMQPVPLCKHVTSPARRRELLAMTSAGAPMVKINLFKLGKPHFSFGKFPTCFAKRLVCFASLRVGGQFVAHATFLQRKATCPGHALRCVTKLPRERMEQREEQCTKPLFSDKGSPHSAR